MLLVEFVEQNMSLKMAQGFSITKIVQNTIGGMVSKIEWEEQRFRILTDWKYYNFPLHW